MKQGFALLAEVFDGGVGDCPHLLEACQEWTRQWNEEERRRRTERIDFTLWNVHRDRINAFLLERIRVEAAYRNVR